MSEFGVVVVDDHPIVLDGLCQLLAATGGFTVLAACTDCAQALAAVQRCRPDILLLDARLPDRDGVGAIGDLLRHSPATRIVVFTATLPEERILEALHAGAKAVLWKDVAASALVEALRAVAAGAEGIMPDRDAAGENRPTQDRPTQDGPTQDRPQNLPALSPREREIAEWVARGARNKEIARELGLAEGTVKLYIYRAFKKLGVGNRVGLAGLIGNRPRLRSERSGWP